MTLGEITVGATVGRGVGDRVGLAVGDGVGTSVGIAVGFSVGIDGAIVGTADIGAKVGEAVGVDAATVGTKEGVAVCIIEGPAVGIIVGADDWPYPLDVTARKTVNPQKKCHMIAVI